MRGNVNRSIGAVKLASIVGVARCSTCAIIATRSAALLDTANCPANQSEIGRAFSRILRRYQESRPLPVIEGIGSFGAALRRPAAIRDLEVVEPLVYGSPCHRAPKGDTIDAELIAFSVLVPAEALLRRPRSEDAIRTGLRVLVVAREALNAKRTRSINALTALVRSVDLALGCTPSPIQVRDRNYCPVAGPQRGLGAGRGGVPQRPLTPAGGHGMRISTASSRANCRQRPGGSHAPCSQAHMSLFLSGHGQGIQVANHSRIFHRDNSSNLSDRSGSVFDRR